MASIEPRVKALKGADIVPRVGPNGVVKSAVEVVLAKGFLSKRDQPAVKAQRGPQRSPLAAYGLA